MPVGVTGFEPRRMAGVQKLALIDTHGTGVDGGRVLGYDNAHGHHHRHCDGKIETVEFESYESIEKRFEAEVREYLESRKA